VGWEVSPDRKGLRRDYILRTVEESLRRLRTDYIDIYFSHRDDLALDVEEPLRAHEQLLREGKVRCIGASNFTAARLREALGTKDLPHYQVLQPHYNLLERQEFEQELLPVCEAAGLGVVTYFSLASGFLTGKYRSSKDLAGRARMMMAGRYLAGRGPSVLAGLDAVAAETGATPAQIALAWLMARPGVTAPIASVTGTTQLAEIMASVDLRLSPEQLARLAAAGA
jgi:aryl-alcohol dehydrogenase-like predicted oxidoreductase